MSVGYFLLAIGLVSCGKEIEVGPIVDPSYIKKVSKYRSCCGHSYGDEGNRSMKHYFTPKSDLPVGNSTVPLYAPFDGNLISINDEDQRLTCLGDIRRGMHLKLVPRSNPNKVIRIFHANPTVGTGKVKAGQFIAYADLRGCDESNPSLVKSTPEPFDVAFESSFKGCRSVFEVMSPTTLSGWKNLGVNLDNIILSAAYRDENPCSGNDQCLADSVCLSGQTCNWPGLVASRSCLLQDIFVISGRDVLVSVSLGLWDHKSQV